MLFIFLVRACCDVIRNSNVEEDQIEDDEDKQNIHLPPYIIILK